MGIDHAGYYPLAASIDRVAGVCGIDILVDSFDLAVSYRYVGYFVSGSLCIENSTVCDQQIVVTQLNFLVLSKLLPSDKTFHAAELMQFIHYLRNRWHLFARHEPLIRWNLD
jgi:hypothetical protein